MMKKKMYVILVSLLFMSIFLINESFVLAECTYEIMPKTTYDLSYSLTGIKGSISTETGCDWSIISNVDWITVGHSDISGSAKAVSGISGSGDGEFILTVKQNKSIEPREGTVTAADITITITQEGAEVDIKAKKVNLPKKIKSGKKVKINTYAKNIGDLSISNSKVDFYISNNSEKLVDGDTLLGTKKVKTIYPGKQSRNSFNWKVNSEAGEYYVKTFYDSENAITETNEINNIGVSKKVTVK